MCRKFNLFLLFSVSFISPGSQYSVWPVHYKYEFFKFFNINNINSSLLKLENRRNSLHTNGAEPFGIFLILEKFICLLFYFITFTMNPCAQGFSLLGDGGLPPLAENLLTHPHLEKSPSPTKFLSLPPPSPTKD